MADTLYQIKVSYACFGIVAKNGVVVEAAPIAKWTVGKDIQYVLNYYRTRKRAVIEEIRSE